MTKNKKTVCLSMIVKNEEKVIERCLQSVKPFIDTWLIVDTGSTDKTKELVEKALEGVPGEIIDRPWKDFGSNRSEAVALARPKADYAFVIDADDKVGAAHSLFEMPELTGESYEIRVEDAGIEYYRIHFFRSDVPWRYEGVCHEYPTCDKESRPSRLEGLIYTRIGGGARSRNPDKFKNDAALLKRALEKDPLNCRYAFYLAQSYKDGGEPLKAIAAYERRASMKGGFYEEIFMSRLEIARLRQKTRASERDVVAAYVRAYETRPQRVEPLVEIARYYRSLERFAAAYLYARAAVNTPLPPDILFIDRSMYEWGAIDEFAISAFYVGEYEQARLANETLLASPTLPASERARVEKNLGFCLATIMQMSA